MDNSTITRKKGDWNCACGELNFATRNQCRKCGKSKQAPGAPQPADWNCSICGYMNFASNQICRACKSSPSLVASSAPSSAPAPTVASTNVYTRRKPGDWTCSCGEYNFADKVACRKCRAKKNVPAANSQPAPSIQQPNAPQPKPQNDDSGNQCIVCMDAQAEVAITACGHLSMCMKCAQSLQACPMCRTAYTSGQLLKVFLTTS